MIQRYETGPRYSRVVVHGNVVYLAGMTAEDRSGDVTQQTRDVLSKIDHHLALGGSDRTQLLSVTIWLADLADFEAMNAVWEAWVDPVAKPARATVQAVGTGPNCLIEIMATAASC
jgi:enamine deaminase RidA (YjgF/YER057c/UK114 family)